MSIATTVISDYLLDGKLSLIIEGENGCLKGFSAIHRALTQFAAGDRFNDSHFVFEALVRNDADGSSEKLKIQVPLNKLSEGLIVNDWCIDRPVIAHDACVDFARGGKLVRGIIGSLRIEPREGMARFCTPTNRAIRSPFEE